MGQPSIASRINYQCGKSFVISGHKQAGIRFGVTSSLLRQFHRGREGAWRTFESESESGFLSCGVAGEMTLTPNGNALHVNP